MTLSITSHQVQDSSKATKIYVLVTDLNFFKPLNTVAI